MATTSSRAAATRPSSPGPVTLQTSRSLGTGKTVTDTWGRPSVGTWGRPSPRRPTTTTSRTRNVPPQAFNHRYA
jgi:hypothetical protein